MFTDRANEGADGGNAPCGLASAIHRLLAQPDPTNPKDVDEALGLKIEILDRRIAVL
jgi:hypothetical protein